MLTTVKDAGKCNVMLDFGVYGWVGAPLAGLLAGGLMMLAMALYYQLKGKPYPPRRDPKKLGTLGLLTLAAVGCAKAFVPAVRPHARPEVSEAGRFESTSHPALKLSAPLGWVLTYDAERRSLRAVKGRTVESASVLLEITSDLTEVDVDTDAFQQEMLRRFGEQGLEPVGALTTVSIGGIPATRLVARAPGDTEELCSWHARRERRYAAHLTCVARQGACVESCQPALDGLTWLTPADIPAADLD